MTGRCPVRFLSGLCLAGMLAACGGAGVNTAADNAAASAAGEVSGEATPSTGGQDAAPPTAAAPTGRSDTGNGSRGNPGAPGGADPAGGGDAQAQGKPGAPGDVAVFEEAGVPYSVLEDDAAGKCANGVCTLLDPVVGAGNADDVGGVDECIVQKQSDIRYDPPAQGGFFVHGATVQATVDCTVDSGNGDTQSGDTSTSGSQPEGASNTSGDAPQDQIPADQPQG